MADAESKIAIVVDSAQAVQALQAAGIAVEGFAAKTATSTTAVRTFALSVRDLRGALMGLQGLFAGIEVADLARQLIHINATFEQTRLALMAGHDSMLAAGADFAWLQGEAFKLGTPLEKLGIEFARLSASAKGTALQGQPVRELFDSLGGAMVATGRDVQNMSRGFYAVSEMLSTMQVNLREVRMLSIQLPGGMRLIAEAWAKATNQVFDQNTAIKFQEAVRKRLVDAVQLLSALPTVLRERFGPALAEAIESSPVLALNRLKVAWQQLLYTLGQAGGFMKQFVGMINDITRALGSMNQQTIDQDRSKAVGDMMAGFKTGDLSKVISAWHELNDAAKQTTMLKNVKELADGMGVLMGIVRQAVTFVVEHLRIFAAAFTGYVAGIAVLALKAFTGWLMKVAEVSAVADLIASPWMLLAGAIGLAIAALLAFGSNLVTINGQTARVIDLVTQGFAMIGSFIKTALTPVVEFLTHWYEVGKAILTAGLASKTAQSFFSQAWQVLVAMGAAISKTFHAVFNDIIAAAQSLWAAFSQLIINIIRLFDAGFQGFTFAQIVAAAEIAGTVIFNFILGIINAIGATIRFGADLVNQFVQIIQPIFVGLESVVSAVSDSVVQLFTSFGDVPTQGITTATTALLQFEEVVSNIIGFIAGLVAAIAGIAGPILETIASVFRGVMDAISGVVVQGVGGMNRLQQSTLQLGGQVKQSGDDWIEMGNSAVGGLLTVLRTIGVIVEAIGVLINTVLQLGNRMANIVQAGGAIMSDEAMGNWKGVAEQGKILADQFSKPMAPTGMGALLRDAGKVGQLADFTVISRSVTAFNTAKKSADDFFLSLNNGFTQFSGPNSANQAGGAYANSYLQGMIDTWTKGASKRTATDAAAKAAALVNAQKLSAAQQAALDQENAGVDRTSVPDGKDAKKHHHKTPAERAAEAAQKAALDAVTDAAELENVQKIDTAYEHINAVLAAQHALNSAGLPLTVEQALALGGVAARLVKNVELATEMKDQLEKAGAAAKKIGENQAAVQGTQEDISLGQQFGFSGKQFDQAMAAQKAIRDAGLKNHEGLLITTQGFADAMASIGDQAGIEASALGKSASETVKWTQALEAAKKVADSMHSFKQQEHEVLQYAAAASQGSAAVAELTAKLAAEHAVMEAFGDKVFDPAKMLSEQGRAIYDGALAMAKLGTSGADVIEKLRQQREAAIAVSDPLRAQRDDIVHNTEELNRQVDAWYKIVISADEAAVAQAKASGNDGALAAAMSKLKNDADAYHQAQQDIVTTSQRDINNASSNVITVIQQHYKDAVVQAQQFSQLFAQVFDKAVDSMASTLADFITTGKADFASMAVSIINDIVKIIAKWAILKALGPFINMLGTSPGSLGAAITGAFGGATGNPALTAAGTALTSAATLLQTAAYALQSAAATMGAGSAIGGGGGGASTFASIFSSIASAGPEFVPVPFAGGGIMTSGGMVQLRKYASGGVANSAQLAMFGEGSKPEAYVPLPDGRTIPVKLAGGGGNADMQRQIQSGIVGALTSFATQQQRFNGGGAGHHLESNVHIENHFNGNGGLGQASGMNEDQASAMTKRLHSDMKELIVGTVMEEMRPGGTFNTLPGLPGQNIAGR